MKTVETPMQNHKIVSGAEWLEARKAHLGKEEEFTRLRDELGGQQRCESPWVKGEKNYMLDGSKGKETFDDVFDGLSELIVYHFLFGDGWEEGAQAARSCPITLTAPWFI